MFCVFVCRGKLRSNLCPTCFQAIGFNRCFAIEQMADAVKVPFSNSNFGCDEYITSQKMVAHLKDQRHRFSITLSPSTNGLRQTSIMTKTQRISIPRHSRFVLLVGEDQSMFLMVNTCVHIGNALTTVCIRPHESGSCYSSKISAVHHAEGVVGRYLFQMDPHVSSSSLHGGVQLGSRFFLLVPRDLVDESTDELTINISIEKIKCAAHQWSRRHIGKNWWPQTFGVATTGLKQQKGSAPAFPTRNLPGPPNPCVARWELGTGNWEGPRKSPAAAVVRHARTQPDQSRAAGQAR
ncbi:E3 ubiquitin-protein ligase SINA-like 7 [Miscanthus floridulus]|uniref:E3 ubiquitin-protein ligase SINA-like 7 n=1 Tax=Miscanthus floridulus TaxID=154761 RepID=UPI003459F174